MFDNLFKKLDLDTSLDLSISSLSVDVHSHILPQIDDGSASIEQSIAIIRGMEALGYKKIIATPHVMKGYYDNAPEDILQALQILKRVLRRYNIAVEIDAAAEYYLDDNFFSLLQRKEILTFGSDKRYLLFETSFVTRPSYILEAVLKIKQAGYTPVLAHPERCINLNSLEVLNRLIFNGALFQINIGSLTGFFSKQTQELAETLIRNRMVSFLGSDCHSEAQLESLKPAFQLPFFLKVMKQNLLNNSLLNTNKIPVF